MSICVRAGSRPVIAMILVAFELGRQ